MDMWITFLVNETNKEVAADPKGSPKSPAALGESPKNPSDPSIPQEKSKLFGIW